MENEDKPLSSHPIQFGVYDQSLELKLVPDDLYIDPSKFPEIGAVITDRPDHKLDPLLGG